MRVLEKQNLSITSMWYKVCEEETPGQGVFFLPKIRNRITKQKHMCPTYWMKIRQIYQFTERRIEE